jgi:serine protease Do
MRVLSLCVLLALSVPAFARAGAGRPPEQGGRTVQVIVEGSQIGVSVADVQPGDVARYKLPGQQGAVVTSVSPGMPAEKAGIKSGDVIVDFDGDRIRSVGQLTRLIRETPAGRNVKVAVIRDGKRLELWVTPLPQGESRFGSGPGLVAPTLPPRPYGRNQPPLQSNPRIVPAPPLYGDRTGLLGIGVQDLTPQLAEYFATKDGVLVGSVTDNSPASRAGVKAGDVITSIDGAPVRQRSDVRQALTGKRAGGQVKLGVVRDRQPLSLTVKWGKWGGGNGVGSN